MLLAFRVRLAPSERETQATSLLLRGDWLVLAAVAAFAGLAGATDDTGRQEHYRDHHSVHDFLIQVKRKEPATMSWSALPLADLAMKLRLGLFGLLGLFRLTGGARPRARLLGRAGAVAAADIHAGEETGHDGQCEELLHVYTSFR